tara:strand:+ start:319 stop:897 length:579 start_codon:yes stop_codon:yes gene_type:complete
MSDFSDFFPAAGGGGGGGIPKYQDFITSGTFTPTQALIDAGGRVSYFVVAGGQRGLITAGNFSGGSGGEVEYGYMTLTSTTGCIVTIGAGGSGSDGTAGALSSVAFSSAGGTDITANGGTGDKLGKNWGAYDPQGTGYSGRQTAFSGVNDFSKGGGGVYTGGGVGTPKPNTGCGSKGGIDGASGFTRITWFE